MGKIICIVGPTASGKTALGVQLAKKLGGEIVSADSMQIYRGMDIGTAKPSIEERGGVAHHMIDIADPRENYSVSHFVDSATSDINDIEARGKTPIVVGGTGLYVDALIRGSDFASFDPTYRAYLSEKSAEELWNMLLERDTARAEVLHEKDLKRVMRSLEVIHLTGETIAEHDRKSREAAPRFDACIIGLTCRDRQTLYERIEARVDEMLKAGLIDEIKTLQKSGITEECTAMQAIGYKELWNAAQGRGELETAVAALKQATRHLAKRQLTWFKRNPAVHWLYMDESLNFDEAIQISTDFIKKTGV